MRIGTVFSGIGSPEMAAQRVYDKVNLIGACEKVSNSMLYKQAGNSISVNMMEMIFKQIEKSRYENCLGGLF